MLGGNKGVGGCELKGIHFLVACTPVAWWYVAARGRKLLRMVNWEQVHALCSTRSCDTPVADTGPLKVRVGLGVTVGSFLCFLSCIGILAGCLVWLGCQGGSCVGPGDVR